MKPMRKAQVRRMTAGFERGGGADWRLAATRYSANLHRQGQAGQGRKRGGAQRGRSGDAQSGRSRRGSSLRAGRKDVKAGRGSGSVRERGGTIILGRSRDGIIQRGSMSQQQLGRQMHRDEFVGSGRGLRTPPLSLTYPTLSSLVYHAASPRVHTTSLLLVCIVPYTHHELERITQVLINNGYAYSDVALVTKRIVDKRYTNQENTTPTTSDPIKLFYKNHMSSDYKTDEKIIKDIIHRNVRPIDQERPLALIIYYKTRKTSQLLLRNTPHVTRCPFKKTMSYTNTPVTVKNVDLTPILKSLQNITALDSSFRPKLARRKIQQTRKTMVCPSRATEPGPGSVSSMLSVEYRLRLFNFIPFLLETLMRDGADILKYSRKGMKLKSLSLQEKVKVLARMDAGASMRAICAEFDIKSSTFYPFAEPHRQMLDPKVQKEIAMLQGKEMCLNNGPGPGVKGFRHVPSNTARSLNERFTEERMITT
ncbi:hypothetical protein GWK47_019634 [Chionoecetes opilio]|uniref:Uncharacterized protein n=1 Tax=Chionoecetes opilio TaxID=41210 RepID=A0A8J5BX59_CHIOP|nr:hypothetical protein GWK47_019634 [Chionoecetes opilio]